MGTELRIYPDGPQADKAIVTVAYMLVAGDEIDVHAETSPPWIRVVAADAMRVVAAMREMGVRVEVQRS
ncbi:hypothetical protein [Kitasatospora sp. NPDC056531]|uniref:hypothetical protein n=1 Tax=Kitasatospora sp. NPDC056531 TaxID=3345856 RepID=UPI0036C54CC2